MNELIAGIYGTGGHEKVASEEGGQAISSLRELATAEVLASGVNTKDLEKVASATQARLEDLMSYDRSGRAMAHYEFSQMEKEAAEGNPEALELFFSDMIQEQPEQTKIASLKEKVIAELNSRLSG